MAAQSLADRLRAAMNEARKQRDQARTLLLSTILSDIKNREIELNHLPSDDETAEVLRRGIKRRRESVEIYEKPGRRARGDRRGGKGHGQGDGRRHAEVQGTRGRQGRESDRTRGAGRIDAVLATLEFPEALSRVAEHAAGPLGAARVRARRPEQDPATIRAALVPGRRP